MVRIFETIVQTGMEPGKDLLQYKRRRILFEMRYFSESEIWVLEVQSLLLQQTGDANRYVLV